ncbi:MAG: type III pantothenate kinase [candidate division KSB1 bacterium]|nr:type III pantothenate kinase [candidate division KSB1 bacterium]
MLLAIDVGNTHVVVGVFDGEKLLGRWRLASGVARTEDELWALLKTLSSGEGVDLQRVRGVAVSSVVPSLTPVVEKMARRYLDLSPLLISAELDLGMPVLYEDPRAVGADRICNAVAGYHLFGGPLVVVDFGTATTFDVVTRDGEYLGGIICTGLETSAYLLHRYAAKLPKVELAFPPELIGRNTENAIRSGLMWGAVEMVDGLVRRLRAELGEDTRTVATGGLARLLVPKLREVDRVEPDLTLIGIRLVYTRVMG